MDDEKAKKDREALIQARLERKLRKRRKVCVSLLGYEEKLTH
jgi:hypothetical protein